MKVDIQLSPSAKRVIRFVALPAVVLVGTVAIAHATIDTTWIQPNQQISASKLKANLDQAEIRLAALEAKPVVIRNGKKYSLGATFCGATALTNGNITNRYAGAKGLCEALPACGSSSSAHLCTGEELTRSVQMGITIFPTSGGSYAGGVFGQFTIGGVTGSSRDCVGWSSAAGTEYVNTWDSNGPSGVAACSMALPLLCCD